MAAPRVRSPRSRIAWMAGSPTVIIAGLVLWMTQLDGIEYIKNMFNSTEIKHHSMNRGSTDVYDIGEKISLTLDTSKEKPLNVFWVFNEEKVEKSGISHVYLIPVDTKLLEGGTKNERIDAFYKVNDQYKHAKNIITISNPVSNYTPPPPAPPPQNFNPPLPAPPPQKYKNHLSTLQKDTEVLNRFQYTFINTEKAGKINSRSLPQSNIVITSYNLHVYFELSSWHPLFSMEKKQRIVRREHHDSAVVSSNDVATHISRGDTYRDQGEYRQAIDEYTYAIKLDSDNAYAYTVRGHAYSTLRQYRRAIEDLDRAIKVEPKNAYAYMVRGHAYSMLGKLDNALTDLDRAIELEPKNAYAYTTRGYVYDVLGKPDRAIRDLDRAIEIQPKLARAYFTRGLAFTTKKKNDLALADFTQVIRLTPSDPSAYYNRGLIYSEEGQSDLALADFTQVIRLDSNNTLAYYNRGLIYGQQHNIGRAIDDFMQAIKYEPYFAQAYYDLGKIYMTIGHINDAVESFKKVLELTSNSTLQQKAIEQIQKAKM